MHLRENRKGEKDVFQRGLPVASAKCGIIVCVCVCLLACICVCLFMMEREREGGREQSLSGGGELSYICAGEINMYLLKAVFASLIFC